jgi:hypothetical protein
MALNFRVIDQTARIHAADAEVLIGKRAYGLAFRIDGRGGAYRVDVEKPLFPAWEAIDGGEGFATLAAARAWVRAWLRAAKAQASLSPAVARATA